MSGARGDYTVISFGKPIRLADVVRLPWHQVRGAAFPREVFSIDECVRIGCHERGTCQCIAVRARPRVLYGTQYFEFYPDVMGGVWFPARDRASRRKVTKAQRRRILARDGHRCGSCGATTDLEVDHIVPVARGGQTTDENLQTLCKGCNAKKGTRAPEAEDG